MSASNPPEILRLIRGGEHGFALREWHNFIRITVHEEKRDTHPLNYCLSFEAIRKERTKDGDQRCSHFAQGRQGRLEDQACTTAARREIHSNSCSKRLPVNKECARVVAELKHRIV